MIAAESKLLFQYLVPSAGGFIMANYWTEAAGTLHPTTTTDRVLIGGIADQGTGFNLAVAGSVFCQTPIALDGNGYYFLASTGFGFNFFGSLNGTGHPGFQATQYGVSNNVSMSMQTAGGNVLIGTDTDDGTHLFQVASASSGLGGTGSAFDNAAITTDGSGNMTVAGIKISGSTTNVEFGYVHGVTSAIQTQLNAKDGQPSVTLDNSTTVTFATDGSNQTRYDTTSTLAASLTIALPSGANTSKVGQILRYVTNRAVTTVTVTGTVSAGPALTSFSAAGAAAWQAVDTAGTWIRIQ